MSLQFNFVLIFFIFQIAQFCCSGQQERPRDCEDVLNSINVTRSGVYRIYPDDTPYEETGYDVFCDLDADGGGWIVIQRRVSNYDFYRTWREYEVGFGNLSTNHWIGLEFISAITTSKTFELRVELEDWEGEARWAKYDAFLVDDGTDDYRLRVVGNYSGNAGNSLRNHEWVRFTTKDNDNDGLDGGNCADNYAGAWWFYSCFGGSPVGCHLNGPYQNYEFRNEYGVVWGAFHPEKHSLKFAEMKIRKRWD